MCRNHNWRVPLESTNICESTHSLLLTEESQVIASLPVPVSSIDYIKSNLRTKSLRAETQVRPFKDPLALFVSATFSRGFGSLHRAHTHSEMADQQKAGGDAPAQHKKEKKEKKNKGGAAGGAPKPKARVCHLSLHNAS